LSQGHHLAQNRNVLESKALGLRSRKTGKTQKVNPGIAIRKEALDKLDILRKFLFPLISRPELISIIRTLSSKYKSILKKGSTPQVANNVKEDYQIIKSKFLSNETVYPRHKVG